ncbi:Spore germination protein B3 precursor [Bacillus subtilis]|nr:Spore germination protein B3 precursor [Bacillus subtilis]
MLQNILDVYTCDEAMRRNIRLFVAKGHAEHLLIQNTGPEYLPAKYIWLLSEHTQKNVQMVEKTRLGAIHSKLSTQKSFLLPVLYQTKQGVKLSGAALFSGKDNCLITILSAKDTAALNYITDSKVRGIFTTSIQKQVITYEFNRVHQRLELDIPNPKYPKVDIYVTADGKIAEIHPSLAHHFSLEQLNQILAKK